MAGPQHVAPYFAGIDAIAVHTYVAGLYAINLSYEYGYRGPSSVANDWRETRSVWEPRPCAFPDRRLDSPMWCAAIEQAVAGSPEPFGWVIPPVRNWNTGLAVGMNAGEGWIRVLGFEPCNRLDVVPATLRFEAEFLHCAARS